MAMEEFNEKATPGEKIRAMLGEAADESHKQEIEEHKMVDMVNGLFSQAAQMTLMYTRDIMAALTQTTKALDEQGVEGQDRTAEMVHLLQHGLEVPPVMMPNDFDATPLGLTPGRLAQLPGYMQLHMIASKMDFAVEVSGIEASEDGTKKPLSVQVNITKSYEQGKQERPEYYPTLPEQQQQPGAAAANDDATPKALPAAEEEHKPVVGKPKPGKYKM